VTDSGTLTPGHPRRWLILFIVLAVECMDLLDATIVQVAAPAIQADLGATPAQLQWIVGGYALALAVGLVLAGRLGDLYGRRRLFILGTAAFVVTSAMCGMAPSTSAMIGFRILQGLAAALMIPQGFGIIRDAFPKDELSKAFGLFGPVIGLSAVLGPIVGGLLVYADLFDTGWRMVFLVNIPLGLLAIVGAVRVLPESRKPEATTLDVVGGLITALAAGLLVFPLIQGHELDWPGWAFGAMSVSGLVLVGVFAWWERHLEKSGRDALITMSMFRKRAYASGMLVLILFFAGMVGLTLVLMLYFQFGLQYSAIHAGLSLVAWSFGMGFGAGMGGGLLAPKFGRKVLHAGFVIMMLGVLFLIWTVDRKGMEITSWQLIAPELVCGFGIGLVIAPLFGFILAAVDDEEVGSASGVLNALQQLAAALGVAILGSIFFSTLEEADFVVAMKQVLKVEVGFVIAAALLTFLLPQKQRPDDELH
jgi:EmrB/QacA subfamily drug resistance transporter